VKQAEPGRTKETTHPERLLDLWMGEQELVAVRAARPRLTAVKLAGVLAGIIAIALLAKYALDVLTILLALTAVGLALHVLGIRLAESELLSPGWFLILVLGVALVGYALFVPASSVAGLGQYMPKWMVAAMEWSESKGWGQRVLVGPGDTREASPTPVAGTNPPPAPTDAGTRSTSRPIPVALALSASTPTSLQGQPVTFMARLTGPEPAGVRESVAFYDGLTSLGTADVRLEGRVRMAYLSVRGLGVGEHQIRATLVGPLGGVGGGSSQVLRHTVVRR
jgi:hypothetical protein